jgi:AcrR family transcriptional regulator
MFKNVLTSSLSSATLKTEHVQEMKYSKSDATAGKILDSALALFREQGFETATMRAIAQRAGVATGAAYYYYASKDAIIMDFYRRSCDQMQEELALALQNVKKLEEGLRSLIRVKIDHFGPNREVLRALLRSGADPQYPLSPFSADTKQVRDLDISWFQQVIQQCAVPVPKDLVPRLPGMLWFFQMGVILFWVTDDSPRQVRTEKLLPLACKVVATLVRFSSLPLMRPLRKPVLELVEIIVGDEQ